MKMMTAALAVLAGMAWGQEGNPDGSGYDAMIIGEWVGVLVCEDEGYEIRMDLTDGESDRRYEAIIEYQQPQRNSDPVFVSLSAVLRVKLNKDIEILPVAWIENESDFRSNPNLNGVFDEESQAIWIRSGTSNRCLLTRMQRR